MIAKLFEMPTLGDVLCVFLKVGSALLLELKFLAGPLDLAKPNMSAYLLYMQKPLALFETWLQDILALNGIWSTTTGVRLCTHLLIKSLDSGNISAPLTNMKPTSMKGRPLCLPMNGLLLLNKKPIRLARDSLAHDRNNTAQNSLDKIHEKTSISRILLQLS